MYVHMKRDGADRTSARDKVEDEHEETMVDFHHTFASGKYWCGSMVL